MAIPGSLDQRQMQSYVESTSVANKPAQAVCNPDGSDIGGGSGSGDVNLHDASGADVTNGQQTMANSLPVVIASNQTAIPVTLSGGSAALTPTSGKVTVAGSQMALGSGQQDKVIVIAGILNSGNVYLGPTGVTSSNGLELEPGRDVPLENVNLASMFVNGTGYVTWLALT
jgi:hypothetical protein